MSFTEKPYLGGGWGEKRGEWNGEEEAAFTKAPTGASPSPHMALFGKEDTSGHTPYSSILLIHAYSAIRGQPSLIHTISLCPV